MRESMVKAAKSKENEEGHGSLQIRMCDRENVRGLRRRACGVAREKKMERKSGADEGCHRIYERKREYKKHDDSRRPHGSERDA